MLIVAFPIVAVASSRWHNNDQLARTRAQGVVRSVYERERKSSKEGLIRKQIDADCHAEQICRAHFRTLMDVPKIMKYFLPKFSFDLRQNSRGLALQFMGRGSNPTAP